MEDIQVLEHLINTFGFPMVMVGYFIWDKTKTTNKLVSVIENNNNILTKLLNKLGYEGLADDVGKNE